MKNDAGFFFEKEEVQSQTAHVWFKYEFKTLGVVLLLHMEFVILAGKNHRLEGHI